MAKSTWGTKREKSPGCWELRYTVDGKRRSETFRGTRAQADRRLAELRIRLDDPSRVKSMTLAQFWDCVYHDEIRAGLAPSTVAGYEQVWRGSIRPAFGDRDMGAIRPRDIQRWLDGMTFGSARHARAVLSAMLSRAFALELVDDNPAQRRFVMPKAAKEGAQRTRDVYDEYELESVFMACRGEVWEAAFILSAFGGASRSEAMSPRVAEVGFVELDGETYAAVPIKRSVQRLKGEVVVSDRPKNEHRERTVIVPPPYSLRLRAIVRECEGRGDVWLTDDGFGYPMCPNNMASCYKRWFIGRPLRYIPFSNLRNAYGTIMHARGVDLSMVAKLMGHAQPGTTYRHYDRPSTEQLIQAVRERGR